MSQSNYSLIREMSLYDIVTSDENIYLSIYLLPSYIQNIELLSQSDLKLYNDLTDLFSLSKVKNTIGKVRNKIKKLLEDDEAFFEVSVSFRPKDYKEGRITYRPLHTAALIDQIAMIAMLQVLIYNYRDIDDGSICIEPSELSKLLPTNFYGNRLAFDGDKLFEPWTKQYQLYSAEVSRLLSTYIQSREYCYDVTLDLKNFFPSIHPGKMEQLLLDWMPIRIWKRDDQTVYRQIVHKLVLFHIDNMDEREWTWYLNEDSDMKTERISYRFAKGIPQGLPHAYFFANLFMIKVQEIYREHIPGKMLFYVDDSVVFTNTKVTDEEIKQINSALSGQLSLSHVEHCKFAPIEGFYENAQFVVEVHNLDGKSSVDPLRSAFENAGEQYIAGLCRETSKVNADIFSSYSEEDISALESRTATLLAAVEKEIEVVKDSRNRKEERENYLKRLFRYRKFFKNRNNMLRLRSLTDLELLVEQVIPEMAFDNDDERRHFFEKYSDDNLATAIKLVYSRLYEYAGQSGTARLRKKIDKAFDTLILKIYSGHTQHAYLPMARKYYAQYNQNTRYKNISDKIGKRFRYFSKLSKEEKEKQWKIVLDKYSKNARSLYNALDLHNMFQYGRIVRYKNDQLDLHLLNAVYSALYQFELNDSFVISPKGKEPMKYADLRTLAMLRNKHTRVEEFLYASKTLINDEYQCDADYSILQVIDLFRTYVQNPRWIDDLIRLHKYCCDTWKNGSKYLYFYTLHNQEHAIALIRSIEKFVHAISTFALKPIDYFILFAACYLHDISMVTMPVYKDFAEKEDPQAESIYTRCLSELSMCDDSQDQRYTLLKTYHDMESYFESAVRSSHARNSAREIRRHEELGFLDLITRDVIAQVSEAHGADAADVYHQQAHSMDQRVNTKVISILLRLADVLDICRYRISKLLLSHNLDDMNETSRFHWISHLLTDNYNLEVVYKTVSSDKESKSNIQSRTIIEKLIFHIKILCTQGMKTTKPFPEGCKYVKSVNYDSQEENPWGFSIKCDREADIRCENKECNFLCKWFVAKNNYLLPELGALVKYLDTLPNNYFSPQIEIRIEPVAGTQLPEKMFEYLQEYVDGK